MLRNYISPLALLALVTTAVPAQSTSYNNIDKRDCIIGTDGLCVDSIDFNPPPNNDLFAFATLPAPDPLDEFSTLEDPFATLGPEDPSDLLFSDYNNFDIFQLAAAGDRLKCTCPTGISSTQGCVYADAGGDPTPCPTQCCRQCCRNDDATTLSVCRPVISNPKCN